jgi:glutamate synthase (ferredoxin)
LKTIARFHPPPPRAPIWQVPDISVKDSQKNLKKSLEKGILKILSKMGISLLGCYHGAQIFEAYGLGREVVDTAFTGSVSRIGGMSFADLQREAESFWAKVRTAGGPGVSGGRGV